MFHSLFGVKTVSEMLFASLQLKRVAGPGEEGEEVEEVKEEEEEEEEVIELTGKDLKKRVEFLSATLTVHVT